MKQVIGLAVVMLTALAAGAQNAPAQGPAGTPGMCPYGGPIGGGGPVWQSDAQAAMRQRVREANWELYRLMNVQPIDQAAVAAQQALVNQLRQEMWAQRDAERQQMWQGRQNGLGGGQGYGAPRGFGGGRRGYGNGNGRRGRGFGAGRQAGFGYGPTQTAW